MFVGPYPYSLDHTYLGMFAQEERLHAAANNMANVNTPGYKKEAPVFEGYLVSHFKTYFGQGPLKSTDNDLDLALDGPGFFQVETPNGIRYTRNGTFNLNSEGRIVTPDGYPLAGAGPAPDNAVKIIVEPNGRVQAYTSDDAYEDIGQIELVEFEDVQMLIKEGYDFYNLKSPAFAPQAAERTSLEQGFLEMSNVSAVNESVQLIDLYRTYEALQKIAHAKQEMDDKALNQLGRLT